MQIEPRAELTAAVPSGQRDHTGGIGHVVTEGPLQRSARFTHERVTGPCASQGQENKIRITTLLFDNPAHFFVR